MALTKVIHVLANIFSVCYTILLPQDTIEEQNIKEFRNGIQRFIMKYVMASLFLNS